MVSQCGRAVQLSLISSESARRYHLSRNLNLLSPVSRSGLSVFRRSESFILTRCFIARRFCPTQRTAPFSNYTVKLRAERILIDEDISEVTTQQWREQIAEES